MCEIDPIDFRAGRHQPAYRAVAEPQYARDHAVFSALKHACALCFSNERLDLFLAYRALPVCLLSEHPEHRLRGHIQQPHSRCRDPRERRHQRRYGAGDGLGIPQRKILRDQFTYDERQVGNGREHDDVGKPFGGSTLADPAR